MDTTTLERVAAAIETRGIRAVEQDVAAVLAEAGGGSVSPVLLGVLRDVREPVVARERAFGRVALRLAADLAHRGPAAGRLDAGLAA